MTAPPLARHIDKVGKTIASIGRAAGVVVDPATGKTATAHDLRRTFGTRWSKLVMPATLKEIMRHADIATTMTYYVGQDAKQTAAELWAARVSNGTPQGNIQGNSNGGKRRQTAK